MIIREMQRAEYPLLENFLYEAIFIPNGVEPPPKSIISRPELQVYISEFGTSEHDISIVADVNGEIVGAIWVRIMNDYGHIDDTTPSFAISVLKEYRGKGLGEKFFVNSVAALCASLGSVKKIVLLVNSEWKSALRIYEKWGFVTILTLKEFFPTLQKKVCADGIIMEAPAERFRAIQFSGSEDAIKI